MFSAHCGSPHGVYLHRSAGEPPCSFCAPLDPVFRHAHERIRELEAELAQHKRATPETPAVPGHRHYLIGGALIGTDTPTATLEALTASGHARELTAAETAAHVARAGG